MHCHRYDFISMKENGHTHKLKGMITDSIGIGPFHVHKYNGICSSGGHWHSFSGTTGFPVYGKYGHSHIIQGSTASGNINHIHQYSGYTSDNTEGVNEFATEPY